MKGHYAESIQRAASSPYNVNMVQLEVIGKNCYY